jgi:hypothetical protein
MRATLLGVLQAPAGKLVRTLAEPARGLAAVIKARAEKRSKPPPSLSTFASSDSQIRIKHFNYFLARSAKQCLTSSQNSWMNFPPFPFSRPLTS